MPNCSKHQCQIKSITKIKYSEVRKYLIKESVNTRKNLTKHLMPTYNTEHFLIYTDMSRFQLILKKY